MTHGGDECAQIAEIGDTLVLNSHLEWIPEFTMRLADGRVGRGATPRGETPSVYEASHTDSGRATDVTADIRRTLIGETLDQLSLDRLLGDRRTAWGIRTGFALSVAFFEATRTNTLVADQHSPAVLFNLLNGGLHAYTNPVAADFAEILLVPQTTPLERSIRVYHDLLRGIRLALADLPQRLVGGHRVHDLGADPNEAALLLVHDQLDHTGLTDEFTMMIDASAGDWYDGQRYVLPVSGMSYRPHELVDYWLDLLDRYRITMLEDPLAETDVTSWHALHSARPDQCRLLGDNLTSTLPTELAAKSGLVDGVLVKPDQNGTVSGARQFAELATEAGLCSIASHRSIETDIPFLVHFTAASKMKYIKIGPFSDFSAVMRTNELLRIASR